MIPNTKIHVENNDGNVSLHEENAAQIAMRDWFNQLTLTQLAAITSYSKDQWCKWFRGRGICEEVLNRAASRLSEATPAQTLSPGKLLDLIQQRRLATKRLSAVGLNYTPKQYARRKKAYTHLIV